MKITIYELLGLIKDGKAPKKIEFASRILYFDEELQNYFDEEGNHTLFNEFLGQRLYFEIEIIEEDKKIEKLNIDDIDYFTMNNKINEIIDKLNEMGDK